MSVEAKNSIKAHLEPSRERKMDKGIDESVNAVMDSNFESPEGFSVGIETEYYILDENNEPISEEQRDEVIGKGEEFDFEHENIDHELGASMVEIASDPVENLGDLSEIEKELSDVEEILRERVEEKGFKLVRHGANTAQNLEDIERTTAVGKYVAVPNTYGEMRAEEDLAFSEDIEAERTTDKFGRIDFIDPRNENLPANICSTQLNMQADDLEDAVEKANIGYAITPYITALTGNSRFVDGKDLGFNDTRMELWEKGFDIGNFEEDDLDIGKIDKFFEDFSDVAKRMKEQPRIVNDPAREGISEEYAEKAESIPLDVAQGMFWKDTRIKSVKPVEKEGKLEEDVRDDLLVEFRQNSTQPTVEEDIAVHAFYIGRITWEQEKEESLDLPDIENVNKNRYRAMRDGLDSELYDWNGNERDADDVLMEELYKARKGLEEVGIDDPGYLDILEERVEENRVPSDRVAENYYSNLLEELDYDSEEFPEIDCPEGLPEEINYNNIDPEVKNTAAVKATNTASGTTTQNVKAR